MSFSFSYTAPMVSEEQEAAELEAMAEDERRELQADLYPDEGHIAASIAQEKSHEDTGMRQRGVMLLKEALGEIPDRDKVAYNEAMRQAPELVELESDATAFLRCEKWDAWAAALRLVSYWKIRKRLFKDRAFLPMTLAGAMAPDVATLERDYLYLLHPDDYGRPVVFFDRTKVKKGAGLDIDSLIRCQFYVLSTLATGSIIAQKCGHVLVMDVRKYELYVHFNRSFAKGLAAIYAVVPSELATVHAVMPSRHDFLRKVVFPVIKSIFGKRIRHRIVFHEGHERRLLEELRSFGIQEKTMSMVLGGGLGAAYVDQWLEERRLCEETRVQQQQHQALELTTGTGRGVE